MKLRAIAILMLSVFSLFTTPFTGDRHLHAQEQVPVSYICPMDPDVLEDKPGNCPICKMPLEEVRLESTWTCPVHPAVMRPKQGQCPIDRRDLVMVTIAHFYECAGPPKTAHADPGQCSDGKPRAERRELRAHGDHNPRHGGQFFMASDKWHHLEGTYPQPGLVRLYLFDNFTKPIEVAGITGRIVTREQDGKEVEAFDLKPSKDGKVLEARLKGQATLPVSVAAKVTLKKNLPEQRFDFVFTDLSKDVPVPPAPGTTTTGAAPKPAPRSTAAPAAAPPAAAAAAPPTPAPKPVAAAPPPPPPPQPPAAPASPVQGAPIPGAAAGLLTEDSLPGTSKELLSMLRERQQEAGALVKDSLFAQVYVPALNVKGIALKLENYVNELPDQRRLRAVAGIRRLVLAAWQLDYFGDLGNREQVTTTYNTFASAVEEIEAAYAGR